MALRTKVRLPAKGRPGNTTKGEDRPHQAQLTANLKTPVPTPLINARTWTKVETEKQLELIERLLQEGLSERRVWAEMKRAGQAIGFTRTKNLIKRCYENWLREDSDNRRYFRSKQLKQLDSIIAITRNGVRKQKRDKQGQPMFYPDGQPVLLWEVRPNPTAAVRAIEIQSHITGTRAPQEVNINVAVSDALVGTIANLSSAQVQSMLDEYKQTVALAEAAKVAGLLPPSDKAAE